MEKAMSRVAELRARIAADEAELKQAMKLERSDALKRIKDEIKLYGFKTTDFKNVLKTRIKREPAAKTSTKKPSKSI
jgi:hypothetical protein